MAQEGRPAGRPDVECVGVGAEDLNGLVDFAETHRPDLTVVGPDNPLAMGVVDRFQSRGLRIWGPNQKAAQFEASKVFAHEFMRRHGIPTARGESFTTPKPAKIYAQSLGGRCVVKADGLALGKGVLICRNLAEAERAIDEILVGKKFGVAGRKILIQELLEGVEISLHALCDGRTATLFPTSQDHKRALDGDQGLNTGGMGSYSPAPFINTDQLSEIRRMIIQPWLEGCQEEAIEFRGVIYPGLMLTDQGPRVLEFNVRFGDPETQVYLTRLKNDLVDLLEASLSGNLGKQSLEWAEDASVCVVMASGGYPGKYEKGKVISGLGQADALPGIKVFHAGTAGDRDRILTSGGRVLGVTAMAPSVRQAREAAYRAVKQIHFEEAHFRRDIAERASA